jgi:GTP-binding protein YchF
MEIAVIGLPNSGKTTVFNALTRGSAQVAAFASGHGGPNVGVAKVHDRRLDVLTDLFHPRRTVLSEVTYHDIPAAPEGLGKTQSISGLYLNLLQRADALLVVVRAFEDDSVPSAGNGVDPMRDAEAMLYELAFADLEILERRLSRLDDGFKSAKTTEREAITREKAFVERLKDGLESGTHLRDQSLAAEEARLLDGFQLLTAKPLIVMLNLGEDQSGDGAADLADLVNGERSRRAAFCGKLEMELAQMDPADELEFRESLGLPESGLEMMLRTTQDVTDVVNFFTVGEDEVRAWPIGRGTPAVRAAGKIHTDLERGFIRAEVVSYDDMERCATLAEARKQGVLRQEGKTYVVQDGDIMNILFNL